MTKGAPKIKRAIYGITLCLCIIISGSLAHGSFISEITEMSFTSEVLECDMPVIVWFYFSESVDVKNPYRDGIDNFAKKNLARIKTLKMDSKFNVITAQKYNIKKNNTFVIFIDGEEKARSIEIRSEKDCADFVNKTIPKVEEKK